MPPQKTPATRYMAQEQEPTRSGSDAQAPPLPSEWRRGRRHVGSGSVSFARMSKIDPGRGGVRGHAGSRALAFNFEHQGGARVVAARRGCPASAPAPHRHRLQTEGGFSAGARTSPPSSLSRALSLSLDFRCDVAFVWACKSRFREEAQVALEDRGGGGDAVLEYRSPRPYRPNVDAQSS